MTRAACESLARANVRRAIWQGSKSNVPFVLELVVGLVALVVWRIADRWTLHVAELRKADRGGW